MEARPSTSSASGSSAVSLDHLDSIDDGQPSPTEKKRHISAWLTGNTETLFDVGDEDDDPNMQHAEEHATKTVKINKSDITDNQDLWFIKEIIARVHHVPIDISPEMNDAIPILTAHKYRATGPNTGISCFRNILFRDCSRWSGQGVVHLFIKKNTFLNDAINCYPSPVRREVQSTEKSNRTFSALSVKHRISTSKEIV
ncbi:hypothetical protein DPMN_070787 [Dreissena polymorpha]|uniref:Uncharacterized protein n=1 Tax=Dreissena polymorpha TaxID=45954 RepID=A0A9D3Z203_DREPO|nr:hypothetical protein DPMN_070787 [Dreissena polymorpha]